MNVLEIPLLATAIAIVIAWGLFSIVCALIHEALAELKAERGRFMKRQLYKQLQDVHNGVSWAALMYQQSNICLLARTEERPSNELPPQTLAMALLESVKLVASRQHRLPSATMPSSLLTIERHLSLLQSSDVVKLISLQLQEAKRLHPGADDTLIYSALLTQLTSWFVSFQRRLSTWYKKKTRLRLFILGTLLALLFNVDSIQLFKYFNRNPTAREAIASVYLSHLEQLESMAADPSPDVYIDQVDGLMNAMTLRLGYQYNIFAKAFYDTAKLDDYLLKVFGILMSGFAASMGAPFWFDLLRQVYRKEKR